MNMTVAIRRAALAFLVALGAASAAYAGAPKHIFVIMMENHGYEEIIGNTVDAPYINKLAARSALATRYFGVTHPSLPNYLAAVSGDYQGIWDDAAAGASITSAPEEWIIGSGDSTDGPYLSDAQIATASAIPHWFTGQTLVDELQASGYSWKAYMQQMPPGPAGHDAVYAPVVNGTLVKLYAQKHNPFEYFAGLHGSANIVPFEQNFAADLASGKVANFVWISPDQCHDMHGVGNGDVVGLPQCTYPPAGLDQGAIQLGDQFLESTVQAITRSRVWQSEASAIVIVWDEDDYTGIAGCCGSPTGQGTAEAGSGYTNLSGYTLGGSRVPLIVLTSGSGQDSGSSWSRLWGGPGGGQAPVRFNGPANHYTLLATLQAIYGLPCLGNTCKVPQSALLTPMFGEQAAVMMH